MKSSMDMVKEAEAQIETWPVEEAIKHVGDPNVVFVDLRDVRELWREGTVPGSTHAPRGMLEFWVDPASPYARPVFQEKKRFVFFCAAGWRSALATKEMQDMGLCPVCHIEGGFGAWTKAGGPVAKVEKK
jgi:rhodanese-related sulfurtransferase